MTICVGALAAKSKAIVCVADKAISYGGYIQWDADSTKIVGFDNTKVAALISGSEGPIDRVCRKIVNENSFGEAIGNTLNRSEQIFAEVRDELIDIHLLRPNLLSRSEFVSASTAVKINPHIKALAEEVRAFKVDCSLMICGFSMDQKPFIIDVSDPGVAVNMERTGFHSVGSGWDRATSRLLWSSSKRDHPLERVLYDAFDAKAHAEMAVGVGYDWDAGVVLADGRFERVPDYIKKLIEQVWSECNRGPYEEREADDLDSPPRNWRKKLRDFTSSLMPSASRTSVGQQ